jgi:DNA-binding GntR family transcriptional regulator
MPTISTRIYKELATQIISGKLAPGRKLEEKQLAAQFGASRTPIREALRELAARGFIELIPRRGGVVTRISLDQLVDMLEAECEVEALCARLAAQRMTALEKSEIESVYAKMGTIRPEQNHGAYLELNQEFHTRICAGAHNATIGAMTRELRDRLAPFRQSQAQTVEERITRSMQEHKEIVGAILAGNAEEAYETMRRHNARLSVGVLGLLRRQYAADNGGELDGRGRQSDTIPAANK